MVYVTRCLCILVGLVLLAAAGLKLAAPSTFLVAVIHAADPVIALGLPGAGVMAIGLISLESALGSLLVLSPTWHARIFTTSLLTLFAGVLVLRFTQAGAPPCGCLGQTLAKSGSAQAWWDAARNLSFAGALVLLGTADSRPQAEAAGAHPVETRGARAFTLLEVLVSIMILGVLLALLFPALAAVRDRAIVMRSQSDLRQIFVATHAYTTANRETFPRFEPLGGARAGVRHGAITRQTPYFWATQSHWPALLCEGDEALYSVARRYNSLWYTEPPTQELEESPSRAFFWTYLTFYFMSPTLVADPSVFDEPLSSSGEIEGPGLLRGVRQFEITSPSHKGLFVDAWLWNLEREHHVAVFADGSAALFEPDYSTGRVAHVISSGILPTPILSTRHGVRGVDR